MSRHPHSGPLSKCLADYATRERRYLGRGPFQVREEMARLAGSGYEAVRFWMKGQATAFSNQYAAALVLEVLGYEVTYLDLVRSSSEPVNLKQLDPRLKNLGYLLGVGILSQDRACELLVYSNHSQLSELVSGKSDPEARQFDPHRREVLTTLLEKPSELTKQTLEELRRQLRHTLEAVKAQLFPEEEAENMVIKPATLPDSRKEQMETQLRQSSATSSSAKLSSKVRRYAAEQAATQVISLLLFLPSLVEGTNEDRDYLHHLCGEGTIPQVAVLLRKLSSETALRDS